MIHVKYGLANGWSDGNCSKNCEHLKRHKNFKSWMWPCQAGPVQAMTGDEYVWRPSSPGVCIYIMYYRVLYLHVDIYIYDLVQGDGKSGKLLRLRMPRWPVGPLARCKNNIPLSLQFDWVDRVAFAARIDLLCYTIW